MNLGLDISNYFILVRRTAGLINASMIIDAIQLKQPGGINICIHDYCNGLTFYCFEEEKTSYQAPYAQQELTLYG